MCVPILRCIEKWSAIYTTMEMIVIHKEKNSLSNSNENLLRFAISSEPTAGIILNGFNKSLRWRRNSEIVCAIPEGWGIESQPSGHGVPAEPGVTGPKITYCNGNIPLCKEVLRKIVRKDSQGERNLSDFGEGLRRAVRPRRACRARDEWFVVSNRRFATQINSELLDKVLADAQSDIVAVNVSPQLQAGQEKVLTNSQGKLVGFRRFYNDLTQPAPIPDDWPHYLFIKTNVLNKLLVDDALPLSFTEFINNCFSNSLTVRSLNIGGTVWDLETERGLLDFLATRLNVSIQNHHNSNNKYQQEILNREGVRISPSAKIVGKVLFGQNVSIGRNAIIVGPAIIGNDVKIAQGAVIRASIVGYGVSVPQNSVVQSRVLISEQQLQKQTKRAKINCMPVTPNGEATHRNCCANNFRIWPRFSYAGCFKRIADIVASVIILSLFAPILLIIALVIKLTSRGPVFFRDLRQGLHGKAFNCLKFRTMLVGADKIQDKLRVLNQTDGPQFKMADDPRISAVGRFLRDTYIDEIPQFFNVLFGQMSVVGPRPSPESENTLCPSWRDARLLVRPGITGLWQVCRTRQPMKDFQEWIHYDTKYVRDLSLRMDLWICLQTTKKLIKNFIGQF